MPLSVWTSPPLPWTMKLPVPVIAPAKALTAPAWATVRLPPFRLTVPSPPGSPEGASSAMVRSTPLTVAWAPFATSRKALLLMAVLLSSDSVPCCTLKTPLTVLSPLSVWVPVPDLARMEKPPLVPVKFPAKLWLAPLATSRLRLPLASNCTWLPATPSSPPISTV